MRYGANVETVGSNKSGQPPVSCATRLRVWDGAILLEDRCDDSPRLCDHTALSNTTRLTRPCTLSESCLSTGRGLVIQHFTEDGTALHPASFKLKYEFIDPRLGSEVSVL